MYNPVLFYPLNSLLNSRLKSLLVNHTAEIIHKISSVQHSKENQLMFTQYNKWKQTIQCFGGDWEEGESGYCSDLWEERIGIADWNALNVSVWRKEDVGVLWKCLCTFSVQGTDKCKWKTLPATGHAMTVSIKGIEEGQREEVINGKSKRSVKNLSWSKDLLHFIPTSIRRPIVKSLEVNHRKWRSWTIPTGY